MIIRPCYNFAVKVSELGEVGLIARLAEMIEKQRDDKVPSWRQLILGVGDDTAAWNCDGSIQLATVDALREGVHFTSDMLSWEDLGWKA
ncbi:MAG: hypothetical protein ABIH70_02560, partial [Chloroflexota bacterium]